MMILKNIASCLALMCLLSSCGRGGDDAVTSSVERETVRGQVIGVGLIEGAVVCHDQNANGRCDATEPQTRSDATGSYQIDVPKGAVELLLAEVGAGGARDLGLTPERVDVSYRLVSPSSQYSNIISPYSTLVYLSSERDYPLAEDEVRNTLGLPAKVDIKLVAPPVEGSLIKATAKAVTVALKAADSGLNLASENAMDRVIAAFPAALTELPQLRISTQGAAPIDSKETYVSATFLLTNPLFPENAAALSGKIRGRGNSTWGQPKNPYRIQFTADAAYGQLTDFLGMKKNVNWALLADYFDRSLMRNKLALTLGSSSLFSNGLKWTPSGQHLEVYVNDAYVGVYLLTEDIRIDPARLNIKKMSSKLSVNDVDGGYIVEADGRLDCVNDGVINLQHRTPQGVLMCIKKPDEDSITQNQISYIKTFIDSVERDLYGSGSVGKINQASFADWYLIQELFRNVDAVFWSSDFMWKDTDASAIATDRLLNMGPLWDFDRSAGNVNYHDGWMVEGCWVNSSKTQPNWMPSLTANSEFRNLVLARWKQKRPALEKFINTSIATYARRLEPAQQRNFRTWPIFGVPLTNYYSFATYGEEVAFLKFFLNNRMAWLDKAFANTESFDALCR